MTVFTSCEKQEEIEKIDSSDKLDQFGIFGKWGLQAMTINGITDMSIQFDKLEFIADDEKADLKGKFIGNRGFRAETNGQFELDSLNKMIHFEQNNTQKSYAFELSNNWMAFTYFDNDIEFIEDYRKED